MERCSNHVEQGVVDTVIEDAAEFFMIRGWPVDCSSDSHNGLLGSNSLRPLTTSFSGTWIKVFFHKPTTIDVRPDMAAWTA